MEAERTYYYENAYRDISYNQRKNKNYSGDMIKLKEKEKLFTLMESITRVIL